MNVFSRRMMLAAIGAAAVIKPVRTRATEVQIAPGIWDIGLTDLPEILSRQHCEQWCWAASIEAIFGIWGYNAPQEAMVDYYVGRDGYGNLLCQPASDDLMLSCIKSTFQEPDGRRFYGDYFLAKGAETHPYNHLWWGVMQVELAHGRPLLAAYRTGQYTGHAVVVTHIRVQRFADPRMQTQLLGMTIRDPWPDSPNRRQLSLNEVLNLRFIAAVAAHTVKN